MKRTLLAAALFLSACGAGEQRIPPSTSASAGETLRVATFNVSLYREAEGALLDELSGEPNEQLEALKAIITKVSPDILVLNEFDYDETGAALDLFADYLDAGFTYRLQIPSNTGVPSGVDLDGDGITSHPQGERLYGNDAFGYGVFPGQYAMALLSRHPIDKGAVRTFQRLLWQDMPGNLLPADFYSAKASDVFRLSSKNHADVPVNVEGHTLHVIMAHPTPPGFDGPEDRNGRRNYDEVRLLIDYIDPDRGGWLVDDTGNMGGLPAGESFFIAGDLNADPVDGDKPEGKERHAIAELLAHPRTIDPEPRSSGGLDAAERQGGGNLRQSGDHGLDTGDFSDNRVGNLRIDYVIPSSDLDVVDSGVFWPASDEPHFDLVGPGYPPVSSDHRMVWVDLRLPGAE